MAQTSFRHPDRKRPRMKPFKALSRMRRLIADKEDTEQVFHIIEALDGSKLLRDLNRFARTENGRVRLNERRQLAPILDDHDRWRRLPDGTVGRAYVDFMEREGLTAQGLVDESLKFDRERFDDTLEWYGNRLRDTHDLYHVLTGYGRDSLGEAALLGFTWGQHKGNGVLFISYMGAREIQKHLPRHIDAMACQREGKRNGLAAGRIVEEDILALLEEPLDVARARLNIPRPEAYRKACALISELNSAHDLLKAV